MAGVYGSLLWELKQWVLPEIQTVCMCLHVTVTARCGNSAFKFQNINKPCLFVSVINNCVLFQHCILMSALDQTRSIGADPT